MTSDLLRRVHEHREGTLEGFTKTYGVGRLVWFEEHASVVEAIRREKSIKRWRRAWKIALIEGANPQWLDLWDALHAAQPRDAPSRRGTDANRANPPTPVIPGDVKRSGTETRDLGD